LCAWKAPLAHAFCEQIHSKQFLAGKELEDYLEEEKQVKEREAKHRAALDRSRRMREAAAAQGDETESSDSDNEEDEEDEDGAGASGGEADGEGDGDVVVAEPGAGKESPSFGGPRPGGAGGAWDEFLDPLAQEGRQGSFDIYVRGRFNEAGQVVGAQARVRMFPFFERRRRVDAYGEVIDVKGWLMRGKQEDDTLLGPTAPGETVIGKRKREEMEEKVRKTMFNPLMRRFC
jgi:cleavage and polyadenylation specificity factor subunit 2